MRDETGVIQASQQRPLGPELVEGLRSRVCYWREIRRNQNQGIIEGIRKEEYSQR